MKRVPLWEISVTTSLEAEEAVSELVGRVLDRSAAIYTNEETRVTTVSVYCQKRAEWTPGKRAALVPGLKFIQQRLEYRRRKNCAAPGDAGGLVGIVEAAFQTD